jgi:hypothetical protein
VLDALVMNKVRVTSFTELVTGLEDIFMSLTKGDTA